MQGGHNKTMNTKDILNNSSSSNNNSHMMAIMQVNLYSPAPPVKN